MQRVRGVLQIAHRRGPAAAVSTRYSASKAAIGAISITRTRGTLRSSDAQKMRTPARVIAMMDAVPTG